MAKIPDDIIRLTDDQLRQEIIKHNLPAGPITDTTRKAYQSRLSTVWKGGSGAKRTPSKPPAPRRSPKKQSLAAMSSEEEEEEEQAPPPRPTRHATPPVRKSFVAVNSATPLVSITPDKKKSTAKVTKRIVKPPTMPTYDTGSDSDGPAEHHTPDTSRTTHTYWRQSFGGQSSLPSTTPLSNTPYMSEYGRQLSLGNSSPLFNGHSSRVEALKKMPAHRPEVIEQSWTHKFFTKLLPLLLALFFFYLAYCYMGMQANPQEVTKKVDSFLQDVEQDPDTQFPMCKGTQVPGINCILSGDARPALDSLRILAPTIKQKYVDAVCNTAAKSSTGPAGAVDFDELEKILEARGISDPESVMNNIRVLIRHNAKWGLEIVNQGKSVILTSVSLPPLCFLRLKAAGFINVFIIVTALVGGVGALFYIYKAFANKALRAAAIKAALINRIRDRMESTESSPSAYWLPVDALKDELLGTNNVASMQKEWNVALTEVLKIEPRIRTDSKIFGGEECACLVWVPSTSPKSIERSSRMTRGATVKTFDKADDTSSQSSRDHPGMWQGQAFENVEGSFNSPPVSPTQCLKIRQMFVPDRPAGSEGVIDAIMEKCGQNVNILHIKLDKNANECCVYMKTASQADAGRAFKALHGWWFDGNLVTVKFLRLERYHERFPESIQVCIPLRSSVN